MICKLRFLSVLVLLVAPVRSWGAKPLALVWSGPGVCPFGCELAAGKVARMEGYRVKYISPKNMADAPFSEARLWIQPGGKSSIAAKAMGPEFMKRIRNFIAGGGGFVGFCAGMFIATREIAHRGEEGIGVAPGETELYLKDDPPATLVTVNINNHPRRVFYLGGPLIRFSEAERIANDVKVLATFQDGSVAAISSDYGLGRVAVSGFHPEAAWTWFFASWKFDRDGSDRWFARQMIRLADPR